MTSLELLAVLIPALVLCYEQVVHKAAGADGLVDFSHLFRSWVDLGFEAAKHYRPLLTSFINSFTGNVRKINPFMITFLCTNFK